MRSAIFVTLVAFVASALAAPAPPTPAGVDPARVDPPRADPPRVDPASRAPPAQDRFHPARADQQADPARLRAPIGA